MGDNDRCPACLVADSGLTPLQALGIGVALGQHVADAHDVTEAMCSEHRMPYVLGLSRAAVAMVQLTRDGARLRAVGAV